MLVLLSGTAIAVVPTCAKLAFEAGSNTSTVVALRGVIGMVLMILFMAASGQTFRLPERTLAPCVAAGLAHALVAYGFIGSVAHIPVSVAVLIYATHPILLAFVFHRQGRERLTRRKLVFALAVLAGLVLVLGGGFDKPDVAGLALAMLASLAVCGVILLGARAQRTALPARK